jgi:hypothetical protein
MSSSKLIAQLSELELKSKSALQDLWRQQIGTEPPKVSAGLLRLALGYAMQERAMGGLPASVVKQLDSFASGSRSVSNVTSLRTARPGMRLVRVWNDTAHVVIVDDAGVIEWNGRTWRSLSEVARAITGTQWSGPKFFGLRGKRAAA